MKKINSFFLLIVLLYTLTFFAFKLIPCYSEYTLVSIQNDFILIKDEMKEIKLYPKDKYKNLKVTRILFSYAVINKKKYRVGDIIKTKQNI